MNTEEFHRALFEFVQEVQKRYNEDGLHWYVDLPIQANFPWYYVEFQVDEKIFLPALQALDGEFRTFCGKVGGATEGISIRPSTKMSLVVRVKLLWNERPPKPPPDPDAPHVHEYARDVDDYEAWSCTCGKTVTK